MNKTKNDLLTDTVTIFWRIYTGTIIEIPLNSPSGISQDFEKPLDVRTQKKRLTLTNRRGGSTRKMGWKVVHNS